MKPTTYVDVKCKKCAIVIYTELALYVVCSGPCGESFHVGCVDMSRDHLRSLTNGTVWMCERCMSAFNDWKNAQNKPPPITEIDKLHSEISELKTLIVDTLQRTISNDTPSAGMPIHHSTPVPSSIMCGTNNTYTNQCDDPDMNCNRTEQNDDVHSINFSLLLTNIDNAVSESEIRSMVARCLGAPEEDCLSVRKLVSKRIDCSLLDYISFKVVLKKRWKVLALRMSTWPEGIKFREFVYSTRNVWKP